ncbi:MAG: hypothetical protein Q9163_003334 [Psora crenata]
MEGSEGFPDCDLLAVLENGCVSSYNGNLEELKWSQQLEPEPSKQGDPQAIHVSFATVMSAQEARKGLFKNREDILAALDADSGHANSSFLFLLSSSPSTESTNDSRFYFQVYQIRSTIPAHGGPNSRPRLRLLLSQILPTQGDLQASILNFKLYPSIGLLYQQSPDTVVIYNLSGLTPCVSQAFNSGQRKLVSCLRLTSSLLATSTPSSMLIISLPYCSLQAERTISEVSKGPVISTDSNANKSQLSEANVQLISHFRELNTVVALNGGTLMAAPVSILSSKHSFRKRKRGGLLVDSLGHGSLVRRVSPTRHTATPNRKKIGSHLVLSPRNPWSVAVNELGQLLENGELDAFDEMMASENTIMNLHAFYSNQHTVSYVLSKIFMVSDGQELEDGTVRESFKNLKINIWPYKTCDWLIRHGLLTVDRIASSLRFYKFMGPSVKLAPGALIDALAQWDPSLVVMHMVLESPTPLSPLELAHALLAVIKHAEGHEGEDSTRLLTNGETHSSPHSQDMMQVVGGEHSQSQISLTPISTAVSKALLYRVLHRLLACPSNALSPALRDTFSRPQLRRLVDTLRMEIARKGWLSLYGENLDSADSTLPEYNQINIITHVLNGALDTLGPTGWMLGSFVADDLTETSQTISYMKAEISAALEGVEEATYLKGVLGEMLLCGKAALASPSKSSLANTDNQLAVSRHVRPITLNLRDEESGILPLGLKLKPTLPTVKVGAGGEVMPRSMRDMGRLKSKLVGKYTFERIVV